MKLILSITTALAIGIALAAQPAPGGAPADLVVVNGKVYTAGKGNLEDKSFKRAFSWYWGGDVGGHRPWWHGAQGPARSAGT